MKTLELKHLSAYLPYDVQVNFNNQLMYLTPLNFGVIFKDMNYYGLKLYLRPLYDIGLVIKIDEVEQCNFDLEAYLETDAERDAFYDLDYLIMAKKLHLLPYSMVEKLLSWHFDIFGLIDAGLAIDINTLEKQ